MALIKKIYIFKICIITFFFSPPVFSAPADEAPLAFAYTAYALGRLCNRFVACLCDASQWDRYKPGSSCRWD